MIWIIIILGLGLDFLTKRWALDYISGGKVVDLIPGFLDFQYLENRGAAFGIFQGRVEILAVISVVIGLAIIGYLMRSREKSRLLRLALSLIVVGALGNAIDRVAYGFVVDFIHFHLRESWHFPTFNVADMCVVIGASLMMLYVLFFEEEGKGKDEARQGP